MPYYYNLHRNWEKKWTPTRSGIRVEEHERPAQSPDLHHTKHLKDELECRLCPRRRPTSVPDLTNAYVAKRAQIPTATA